MMRFLADAGISPVTVGFLMQLDVLEERPADLDSGALILVEDARYRVRRLPIGSLDSA